MVETARFGKGDRHSVDALIERPTVVALEAALPLAGGADIAFSPPTLCDGVAIHACARQNASTGHQS